MGAAERKHARGAIESALTASGLAVSAVRQLEDWIETMVVNLEALAEDLYAEFYDKGARAISRTLDPVAYRKALNMAEDQARLRAQTLATNLTTAELSKMGKVIADGMNRGQHPFEIAQSLDMVKGLDSGRAATFQKYQEELADSDVPQAEFEKLLGQKYEELLEDRKKTIAQTEARYATEDARTTAALARGAQYETWIAEGGANVCDECAANEAAGPIPMGSGYPSGAKAPPAHPKCRCTRAFVTREEDFDDAKARADARAEETAKARGQEDSQEFE